MDWIKGKCPTCHSVNTLFIAQGGYLTCSYSGCTDPDAASVELHMTRGELTGEHGNGRRPLTPGDVLHIGEGEGTLLYVRPACRRVEAVGPDWVLTRRPCPNPGGLTLVTDPTEIELLHLGRNQVCPTGPVCPLLGTTPPPIAA